MKTLLALLALAATGTSIAAPTTIYFSGATSLYQSVDAGSKTWVASTDPHRFTGWMTIDGSHGTLLSPPGLYTDEIMTRSTSSMCAVITIGQCIDGPPALPNVVAFGFSIQGNTFTKWDLAAQGGTESGSVSKARGTSVSSYTAAAVRGKVDVLASLPEGDRVRNVSEGIGLTIQGGAEAVGDIMDLTALPDSSSVDAAASTLRFSRYEYECTVPANSACIDIVVAPHSFVLEGALDYIGSAPLQIDGEVPEPASAALVLAGLMAMATAQRRRPTLNPASPPKP